ncbi:MAG: isopentenyl phosphate kinase family protein [Chloroflexi bacterium]|nr:isopentenyl phosphate kinase family protein [Chloroflexota bacterium]
MTTLLKLGGSLITDKRGEKAYRQDVMRRIAHEVKRANDSFATRLVIGHGSGSFGHVPASKYGTISGVHSDEEWRGFAEVARVASELNELVTAELWNAGLSAMRMQPSASIIAHDGVPVQMDIAVISHALDHGLIPVVHGDVAFDEVRGGTIVSTESLFTYLADRLAVTSIILAGEVPGVLDDVGQVIKRITPGIAGGVAHLLGGSTGTDVTGGMLTKVTDMLRLVTQYPSLRIQIVNGLETDAIFRALVGNYDGGTVIVADSGA